MTKKELIQHIKAIQEVRGAGMPKTEWLKANREILLMQVKNSMRTDSPRARAVSTQNLWQFLDVFLPARTVYYVVRPAVSALVIVGMLFGGWVTTVSASYNSLPGEYLYSVKIATEAVQVAVAPKPVETKLHAEFAVRRAQEVAQIVAKTESTPEKIKRVETAVKNLQKELDSAKGGLKELKDMGAKAEAAQAAKVVGEKAVEVARVIEQTKQQVAPSGAPVVMVAASSEAGAGGQSVAGNAVVGAGVGEAGAAGGMAIGSAAVGSAGINTGAATKDVAAVVPAQGGKNARAASSANTDANANIQPPVKEVSALKESLNTAAGAADDASSKAIQVLVDTHKEDNQTVTSEEVKAAVDKKIQSVEKKVQSVNSQLSNIVATSTPALTSTPVSRAENKILEKAVEKVVEPVKQTTETAKSALNEAKDAAQNQNFDKVLDKLEQVKDIVKAAEVSVEKIQTVGATSTVPGVGVVRVKTETQIKTEANAK